MNKSKNAWKWLSATILPILGFAACSDPGEAPALYGTPSSDYQFRGRVTDADGKPLQGIKVVSGVSVADGYVVHEDSTTTDADGRYQTSRKYGSPIEWQLKQDRRVVTFEDIDGKANGGTFANDTARSSEMKATLVRKADGSFDHGGYDVEVADKKLRRR